MACVSCWVHRAECVHLIQTLQATTNLQQAAKVLVCCIAAHRRILPERSRACLHVWFELHSTHLGATSFKEMTAFGCIAAFPDMMINRRGTTICKQVHWSIMNMSYDPITFECFAWILDMLLPSCIMDPGMSPASPTSYHYDTPVCSAALTNLCPAHTMYLLFHPERPLFKTPPFIRMVWLKLQRNIQQMDYSDGLQWLQWLQRMDYSERINTWMRSSTVHAYIPFWRSMAGMHHHHM